MDHIVFLTGRLAQAQLRQVLQLFRPALHRHAEMC